MTLLWYSSVFKHLTKCCYVTAIVQFMVFLFFFLGVSYLSTLMHIDYSNEFTTKYEKYVVLAASLYMIVPFGLSNLFLFGLFHKNRTILKVFMTGSLINSAVIFIVVIGSGIYLAVEGTDYIAYSLIGVGFVLELFLAHGIFVAFGIRHKYLEKSQAQTTNTNKIEET